MVAKEREAWLSHQFSSLSKTIVLTVKHGKLRKPWEGPSRSGDVANQSAGSLGKCYGNSKKLSTLPPPEKGTEQLPWVP